LVTSASYISLKNVADPQLPRDYGCRSLRILKSKGRCPRNHEEAGYPREQSDDVFGQPFRQKFEHAIFRENYERSKGNRPRLGSYIDLRGADILDSVGVCTVSGLEYNLKCSHRTFDVFQRESAKVAKLRLYAIDHGIAGAGGNNYAARLGDSFEPGRNVHAIAKNVVVFDYDVADVNSDAKFKPFTQRYGNITLGYAALNVHCAVDGVNDTGKLDQKSVAGRLNYPSAKLSNLGIEKFTAVGPERRERALLVGTHQAAVARNIGRQDGRQPSFDTRLRHNDRSDQY
jgi:hypothetical protein